MFDITSRLNVTRTLGSTVMLGTMLFLSLPAATYALVPSPTLSLTANPAKVSKGGAATLSWVNTKSCTASAGWSGSKGKSGSQTVKNITSSRTYKLTCTGTTKNISASVKVAVISTPPPVQSVVGLNPSANVSKLDAAGKGLIKELGTHSLRLGFRAGKYLPNVDWAVQNGMGVLFFLGYGEGCANIQTSAGRQCYADRSAGLAQELGSKAQYYEVWNEWNGGFGLGCNWKQPPCNNAAMYTDLLCKTYTAVKAVRPILVTEAGFHGADDQREADFITELYERSSAVPFIEGIWWYKLKDGPKGSFGLLRNDNTKKWAFFAFQAAANK